MRHILTLSIILTFLNYGNCKQHNIDYVILKGSCFDYNKGPSIKTDVYSVIDGKKKHLGISNLAGIYRVKVPLSSKFLIFESAGFHSIQLPVRFIGEAKSEVEFLFELPTSHLDSAIVPIEDGLYFGTSKSLLKKYTARLAKKECVVDIPREMIDRGYRGAYMGVTEQSPSIGLLVTSSSEETIMKKQITVGKGLNLLLIDDIQSELAPPDEKKHHKLPLTRYLYFRQTEYKLSNSSITTLDSIINLVKPIHNYRISVAGYTDNVGEKARNITLSEYRARVVAQYFIDKGIKDSNIDKSWFGSENIVSHNNPEKNRRVVIKVSSDLSGGIE